MPLGALLALVVVLTVLPGNTSGERVSASGGAKASQTTAPGGGTAGGSSAGAVSGAAGAVGGATGSATALTGGGGGGGGVDAAGNPLPAGTGTPAGVTFGSGPHCRPDGRQNGVSLYMPPCADWAPGSDNGAATAPGVTDKQVKIIRWNGQVPAATQAILTEYKLSDDPSTIENVYEALFNYGNYHYETYGREVVFENFDATAESTNDEKMIADAATIADKHPFAVIEGNAAAPMPIIMIQELNARGVLCLCSTSLSQQFYAANPLVVASGLPSGTDYANAAGDYACKRLAGKKAQYAGDAVTQQKTRVFGLIYLHGTAGKLIPEYENTQHATEEAFARCGITFAAEADYFYDPGNDTDKLIAMIAKMKDAGVTTIVPLWEPLEPILITNQATLQAYFPEWMVVGTGLSDTTTAARLYDQNQWKHAFGITPLWVTFTNRRLGDGWREYHDARPNDPDGAEGVLIEVYRSRIQMLFRGIHMAGPGLTYDSFRQGIFGFPQTGGLARQPLVYSTPESPTDIKDFAEVFYDINAKGPDERSQQGSGMMVKTDAGKRYPIGQMPADDPHVFRPGGVAVSDDPSLGADPQYTPSTYPTSGCLSCT